MVPSPAKRGEGGASEAERRVGASHMRHAIKSPPPLTPPHRERGEGNGDAEAASKRANEFRPR